MKKSDFLKQRAQLFRSLQKPQSALEDLEHSVSLNPSNPTSWLQIAEIHQAGSDWKSVNDALQNSLSVRIPPPRKLTQTAKAIAEKSCQFFDDKILNESELDSELLLQRALSNQLCDLPDKAVADCNLVLESDPSNISAKHCRAQISNQQENYESAIVDLTAALKTKDLSLETQSQLRFDRAVSHNLLGKIEEANLIVWI